MNFFESYADAVLQELNETGSNIGDIVVDWEALVEKENTTTTYDTSETVAIKTNHTRPYQDGIMPGRIKDKFTPRETETEKLRDIWKPKTSTVEYSEPMVMNGLHHKEPVRIARKKNTQFTRKKLKRK